MAFPKSMLYKPWNVENPRFGTLFTDKDRQMLCKLFDALKVVCDAYENSELKANHIVTAWDVVYDAERYFNITEDDNE